MILDQNIPFGHRPLHATPDALASVLDADAARRAPERIGAGIDRIGQDVVHDVVGRQSPHDAVRLASCATWPAIRCLRLCSQMCTCRTLWSSANFVKTSCRASCTRWSGFFSMRSRPTLHIAGGDAEEQRAAARLLLQRLLRALAEQRQFKLAHRALHAEQQPIIGMARIVDSVLVDDERADQSTELDQRVPVAAIAGKTRRLDREHGADTALADRGQQPLEAGTGDAAARSAEIVVDDLDVAPAKLLGAIGKAVLPAPALMIVRELICRRLPDVDDRRCERDAQP